MPSISRTAICLAMSVIVAALAGCPPQPAAVDDEPVEPATAEVTRRSFAAEEMLGGSIVAAPAQYVEVDCSLCPAGAEVLVETGESVEQGDALVSISGSYPADAADGLAERVQQARANLESADEDFAQLLVTAQEQRELAGERIAALEEAREEPGLSQEEREQITLQIRALEVWYDRAELEIEWLQAQRDDVMERRRMRVAGWEDMLAAMHNGNGDAVVRSPIDGQVTEVRTDEGAPTVVIADTSNLFAQCAATLDQARRLDVGMEALITTTTVDTEPIMGTIIRISRTIEDEDISLDFPDDSGHLVLLQFETAEELDPGRPIEARFDLGEVENALTLPTPAIEYEDGIPYVNLIVGDGTERRYILVGPGDSEYTVIEEGLSEGDEVMLPAALAS